MCPVFYEMFHRDHFIHTQTIHIRTLLLVSPFYRLENRGREIKPSKPAWWTQCVSGKTKNQAQVTRLSMVASGLLHFCIQVLRHPHAPSGVWRRMKVRYQPRGHWHQRRTIYCPQKPCLPVQGSAGWHTPPEPSDPNLPEIRNAREVGSDDGQGVRRTHKEAILA